uniref:BACK domain-containing protein n=2 Tax=Mesocestoides corti TaxID=53468 RepID=A0A5K3FSR5_MESCO
MHAEDARQCFPNSSGVDSPAKNNVAVAAAKNRQKSLLNENLASSSGLVAASPLHFNWQSNRSCVSERVRSLFANTTLADVYFNIHYQPGCDGASTPFVHNKSSKNPSTSRAETLVHRIPAHTFVLAISSAVFEAMFYGPMSVQGTAATAAGKSQQSPHKCSEQPAARQSSWSPSAGVFSMLSAAEPMEDIHVESTGDVDPAELGKVEHTQPVIFNPSSSQITSSSAIEIHLDDVNPVAFTNVLRFIYTDEIQIDASNVLQTLYVAKKYAINVMEIACVDFLSQAITVDNAFMLLGQANFFDEQELAQKCLEVIDKNTAKALDTEDFLALDSDLLRSILERDTLCIREVRLFVSVVKWAEAEYHRLFPEPRPSSSPPAADEAPLTPVSAHLPSLPRPASDTTLPGLSDVPMEALRDILQPLLPHIRFPQMSIEEFADVVVPSGVLEDSMAVKIFQHFITSKTAKPELPFLKRPRCYLHGVEEIVRRFSVVDQRWDYRGTSDRIRFKVDRKIYVVGFGLYGSIHGQSEYEASIEIVHPESGVVLGSNDVTYLADGSPNTFRVAFKEPIPLTPNVNYLASATIKGQDTYYGTRGLREITHECSTGSKVTFHFSYAACMNNGTSVEDGQIPEIVFFV